MWSKEKQCWYNMMHRCYHPNNPSYKYYGGRGIKVCDRWHVFENWWEDVKSIYNPKLTFDRIDNEKDYEPGNVRWVTRSQQNANHRRNSCKIPFPTVDVPRQIQLDDAVSLFDALLARPGQKQRKKRKVLAKPVSR